MKKLVILLLIISISGCAKKEFKFETLNQPIEIEYLTEADNTGQKYVIETNVEIEEFSGIDTYPLGLQVGEYKIHFKGIEKIIPVEFKIVLSESIEDYIDVLPSGRYYERINDNGVPEYMRVNVDEEKMKLLPFPLSSYDLTEDYDIQLYKVEGTTSIYRQEGDGDLAVYFINDDATYIVNSNPKEYKNIENQIINGDFTNAIDSSKFKLEIIK